jgi:hypothetical protein
MVVPIEIAQIGPVSIGLIRVFPKETPPCPVGCRLPLSEANRQFHFETGMPQV